MSVVTKTGDSGSTGLFGGKRVSKASSRIEAYGTVDELNSVLGVTLSMPGVSDGVKKQLTHLQHLLFRVGGDLATPLGVKEKVDRVGVEHVTEIEQWINDIEAALPPQRKFILPGGTPVAAHLHLARTVCRRAEREVIRFEQEEECNPQVRILLNRLSDYFFVLARSVNHAAGTGDIEVQY